MHTSVRVAVFVAVLAVVAMATPILEPAPDISSSFLTVSFNVLTGLLTAQGFADSVTVIEAGVPTLHGIASGSFSLTAQINNLGVASSGMLAIDGCVADLPGAPGCGPGLLLSSNDLVSFTFEPISGGELDFGFSLLGGDLQPVYGGTAVIKMNFLDFPGTFASSFSSSDFSNVADVGVVATPIPEPGTWSLLVTAGVTLFSRLGRRVLRNRMNCACAQEISL